MDFQTLNLLFRCSREYDHRKKRMRDLSDTECMLCSYIHAHPRCSQDEAALALKMDKTTVAKALTALEAKAYIGREKDARDRRIKRLLLTKLGEETALELLAVHEKWLSEVFSCLSEEEQTQFESCCLRLLAAAEALAEENRYGGE